MTTFILLSKVSPSAIGQTSELGEMDVVFEQELARELPEVERIASYALLGEYDFMHIIEAPNELAAAKAALLVNRFGTAATQTLTAIPFEDFKRVTEDVKRIQVTPR
jgi:uncharacterized protein with GYD domain